jgi:hypothetical protein
LEPDFKGGSVQTAYSKAFLKKIFSYEYTAILALLAACLLIGIITVPDYGESWDEHVAYLYGDYAFHAYQYFFHPQALARFQSDLNLYGPAYFMFVDGSARVLQVIFKEWSSIDASHFTNFVVYLAGVWIFYLLVRRWLQPWAAFGASLLFLSQPLFWGHAFINPKDIPYLVFFMTSVYLGFRMVDVKETLRVVCFVILAGFMLGLTSTLRVAGPLAGLIVLIYGFFRLRTGMIWRVVPYLLLALATAYLSWPYLWASPIGHYIESLRTMAQFPFTGRVLFMGKSYLPKNLPWTYFPTLLSLQLTEPALLLAIAGLAILVKSIASKENRELLLLFLGWFLLPVVGIILIHSIVYDNGRQLYFLLPPIFFLPGVALDSIFKRLAKPVFRIGLLALVALPGLYASIRLHPYEYVYYNILVNGTGGAFRSYEMDYWGTSFTEAVEDVNRVAPPHARVLVFGPIIIADKLARPDLQVFLPQAGDTSQKQYDYAVLINRHNLDETHCRDGKTVFTVERKGAVFASVKYVAPGVQCQ